MCVGLIGWLVRRDGRYRTDEQMVTLGDATQRRASLFCHGRETDREWKDDQLQSSFIVRLGV